MKNKYFPFDSQWSPEMWSGKCPSFQYRVVEKSGMPDFLPPTLLDQFNGGVYMASGNVKNETWVFQGYRVDGDEIDEHQYIATYDREKDLMYAGFIEHASYPGRTTKMPEDMINSIKLSGICVDYQFSRKPIYPSGSILELEAAGFFSGFVNSVKVQQRKEGI